MPDDLHAIVQRMIDAGESEENIATVIKSSAPNAAPPAAKESSVGALVPASVGPAANLLMRFGTSPTAPQTGAMVGRITGAIAAPAVGAAKYGLPGFLGGMAGAAQESWAGGKAGYFGTKMLQSAARPIAGALETAAPYAHMLSGAQGLGALAQMAEPTRRDIGVLGIGSGTPDPEHPALINEYAAKLRDLLLARFGR